MVVERPDDAVAVVSVPALRPSSPAATPPGAATVCCNAADTARRLDLAPVALAVDEQGRVETTPLGRALAVSSTA